MATPTYTLISATTLTSPTGSLSISGFPTNFRDLVIRYEIRSENGYFAPRFRINGDGTSGIYQSQSLRGRNNNAEDASQQRDNYYRFINGNDQTDYNYGIINIFDYAQTDKDKSIITIVNAAVNTHMVSAGYYGKTNAVTSFQIYTADGNDYPLGTGSTVYVYGVGE